MAIAETVRQQKQPVASSRSNSRQVEFTIAAPDAKNVSIAGQFNDWNAQAMPMKKEKNGLWKIKLKLPAGKNEYKFVVDGSWINDAACPDSVPNTFGTSNSVVTVH